jgi:hypothetical protein
MIGPQKPKEVGDAAREGTACHKLLELAQMGLDPEFFLGQAVTEDKRKNGEPFLVDQTMVGAVRYFMDTVQGIMLELGIPPENFRPEQHMVHPATQVGSALEDHLFGGTTDFMAWGNGTLLVADMKYGQEPVEPSSPQLTEYAILALANMPPEEARTIVRIEQVIIQPRISFGDTCGRYSLPAEELNDVWQRLWAMIELYKAHSHLEASPLELYGMGDHCDRCDRITNCPKVTQSMNDAVASESLVRSAGNDPTSQVAIISYWLERAEPIRAFLKAIDEEAWKLAKSGHKIPGRKLVYSFGHRAWKVNPNIRSRTKPDGTKPPARVAETKEEMDKKILDVLRKKLGLKASEAQKSVLKTPAQVEQFLRDAKRLDKDTRAILQSITAREVKGVRLVDEHASGEEVKLDSVAEFEAAFEYEKEVSGEQ